MTSSTQITQLVAEDGLRITSERTGLPDGLGCPFHAGAAQSLQSRLTLRDPMDWSPLGSSVHGVLQARILEWVIMPSSRGSSRPRKICISCIAGRFFTTEPSGMLVKIYLREEYFVRVSCFSEQCT